MLKSLIGSNSSMREVGQEQETSAESNCPEENINSKKLLQTTQTQLQETRKENQNLKEKVKILQEKFNNISSSSTSSEDYEETEEPQGD